MMQFLSMIPAAMEGMGGLMGGASQGGGGIMSSLPPMGGQSAPGGVFSGGSQSIVPNAAVGGGAEARPSPPSSFTPGDPSAFAAAGLTPPPLKDATGQLQGLMNFMGDPHQNRAQDPFAQMPQGGLMSYLQSLGV